MKISGKMKVKTLKSQFKEEFGLTLRVYDGRSFADDESTLASIRKGESKGGEFSPRKNLKVGNFEDKIMEMFGIKVQVAGSDDSYLCNDDDTLAKAQEKDEKKRAKRQRRAEDKSSKAQLSSFEKTTDEKRYKFDNEFSDRFIALSVAPECLTVEYQAEVLDNPNDDEIAKAINNALPKSILSFKYLTDNFYYFRHEDRVSPVGILLENSGGGLRAYLMDGESLEIENDELAYVTYDQNIATKKTFNLLTNSGDGHAGFRIRLFRICIFDPENLSVDIDDLSEFPEQDVDDFAESNPTKLLNELSEEKDPSLGDDIEAYLYNEESIVLYQCWEDGGPYGEGYICDPDDEDWQIEPDENALKQILSGC